MHVELGPPKSWEPFRERNISFARLSFLYPCLIHRHGDIFLVAWQPAWDGRWDFSISIWGVFSGSVTIGVTLSDLHVLLHLHFNYLFGAILTPLAAWAELGRAHAKQSL